MDRAACLFISEGTSDQPLASHIERIAAECGTLLRVTTPDFSRLPARVGSTVGERLTAAHKLGERPQVVAVHRDANGAGRAARLGEIQQAVELIYPEAEIVPVIPDRMTEAWILTDEEAIRRVAANPSGRVPLNLPTTAEAARLADPKARLREALALASEARGRKRETFNRRFPLHRRQLLETMDPNGLVSRMPSWQMLVDDVWLACEAG